MTAPTARGRRSAPAALAALALLAAGPPRAEAGKIKQSVWDYAVAYPAGATAEYARVTVDGLTAAAFDAGKSFGLILRPTGDKLIPFLPVTVPVRVYQDAQGVVKPGQLEVRLPRTDPKTARPTFFPGDIVAFRVVLKPGAVPTQKASFRVSALQWKDGDGGAGQNDTVASSRLPLTGGAFVADPEYAATNDADPDVYPSAEVGVRNLRFSSNVSESQFLGPDPEQAARDLHAALGESGGPSPPGFVLAPGQERRYFNPFAEPDPGNYSGATGQLYDPATGEAVGAFRHGYTVSAVPEPATWAWLVGAGVAGGVRAWRRARRPAA